jgi:hypothetical protein
MIPEIHYVPNVGSYDEAERDDDGALRFGETHCAEEIWYWYATGDYCGGGVAILRGGDGRWGVAGLSHCSCNGPWDNDVTWHPSLAALRSKEGADDAACLFAVIGDR